MRLLIARILLTVVFMTKADEPNLTAIDSYLTMWDRFAQGDNSLVPKLKESWPVARSELVKALEAKDRRAPSRVVFLVLVQIGGSIPVDSEIGRAWHSYAGEFPSQDLGKGSEYFAADFYGWWKRNQSPSNDLPLLVEWLSRDLARTKWIPMYERLSATKQ